MIRSQVSGSPSTTRPAPFGSAAPQQVARRVHPRLGGTLRAPDAGELGLVLHPPAVAAKSLAVARHLDPGLPRSRSANSIGNVGGTTASSTPSAWHALTTTPRSTSSRGKPCAISSSKPNSSYGARCGPPGIAAIAVDLERRRDRRAARRPARRRGTDRARRSAPRAASPASGRCRRRSGRPARRRESLMPRLRDRWTKRSQRAQELVAEWDEELRRELPDGRRHLRRAPPPRPRHRRDGRRLRRARARHGAATASRARSCSAWTSPTGTRGSGRRTTGRSSSRRAREGRLIPFVRLDLGEEPIEEAERCLDRGARGIKLHPRAQRFLLNDERLAPVFALAAERRVPILIHGGPRPAADRRRPRPARRRLPRGAADHRPRRDRRPRRADARTSPGKAGVFFDTSAWSPIDLLDFFRQVSPEQVLYASDYPYGQQPSSLLIALRTARVAGLDDDADPRDARRQREPDRRRRAAARADARRRAATRSRSRWCSPASTSTSRWRRRSSGRASRTRSACSASR